MSLLDFLKGVLSLFISNFPKFVQKVFNKIPDKLKDQLEPLIEVVNLVKGYVDSPLAEMLVSLTGTKLDDKILDWVKVTLPIVLEELNLLNDGIIKLSEDTSVKGGQLRAVSSVLTEKLTGMPPDQAAITTAIVYRATK